jgi:hypothetical protein
METMDRLRGCTGTVGRGAAHGWVRGSGGTCPSCCASLSYGFLQVSGEVEDKLAMDDHVVVRLLEVACEHLCGVVSAVHSADLWEPTISTRVQVDYRPYADIYDTEKALVLLLELLLVKDLNRENALLIDSPAPRISVCRSLEADMEV